MDVVIQVRLDSERLPGKAFLEVCGKPLLEFVIERCQRAERIGKVIVATTDRRKDDQIADYCTAHSVPCFRGAKDHVLDRFYRAASLFKSENLVRITADCPLIDPQLIDEMVHSFLWRSCDYLSTDQEHCLPRGFDVEVFSFAALKKAYLLCSDPAEQEHVTLFIKRHPELFQCHLFQHSVKKAHFRLTVDKEADFLLVREVIEVLYPKNPAFSMHDVFAFLEKNPELAARNRHIEQKPV